MKYATSGEVFRLPKKKRTPVAPATPLYINIERESYNPRERERGREIHKS